MGKTKNGLTKIAHRQNEKLTHPNSRKAAKMHKKNVRKDRLQMQKKASNDKLHGRGAKFAWFADRLEEGKETYTYDEICDLISEYIDRNQEEVQSIKDGKKVSKQHELLVMTRVQQEREIFNSGAGFEAPDLRQVDVVQRLTGWDGSLKEITAFKTAFFQSSKRSAEEPEAEAAEEGVAEMQS